MIIVIIFLLCLFNVSLSYYFALHFIHLDINFTETATPNISIWSEFNVHQTFSLKCSTISKPLLVAIQGSLSTKYGGNVIFKPKADMQGGEFTVTEAQLSNTGNYTCMATNGIVFRNMTYSTFIGGLNE